jgi:hypothetical protein
MNREDILKAEKEEFHRDKEKYQRALDIGKKHSAIVVTPPILKIKVTKMPSGELVERRKRYSQSVVRNWSNINLVYLTGSSTGSTYADGSLANKRDTGVIYDTSQWYIDRRNPETEAGYFTTSGLTGQGIILGTDNTPESFDDFNIGTVINQGTGAGQMDYQAMTFTEGWNAGGPYYWSEWERNIDNVSGGAITVNEIVLAYRARLVWSDVLYCFVRDVIGGGQVVAHTERLTVQYQIRMSYP